MARQDERGIAIAMPGEDWALEGVFTSGEGPEPAGALIAPPHPLYGGSMDSPVVAELAFALSRSGYAALRFNWRGVGASGGSASGEASAAAADYGAALDSLADSAPGPLLAAGYSFGATTAARVGRGHPRVRRLLLVAPPPALLDADALDAFRGSTLIVVGERDRIAPPAELEGLLGDAPRRRLAQIPHADHFFQRGLGELGRQVRDWLAAPSSGAGEET